jgi:hypothetical protein
MPGSTIAAPRVFRPFRHGPLLAILLGACVRLPPPPVIAPGSGPPLFLVPEAACRTDEKAGAVTGAVPDKQLCTELLDSVGRALHEVGYRVVARPDEPHAARVHLFGHQSAVTDYERNTYAYLTVQATVEYAGQEVERAVEDANVPDPRKRLAELRSLANALAETLAHSPRLRRAGLLPRLEPPR